MLVSRPVLAELHASVNPFYSGSTAQFLQQRGLIKDTFLHLGGQSSSSVTASICPAEASSSQTLNRHLLHIVDGAVTLWNTEAPFSASRSQSAAAWSRNYFTFQWRDFKTLQISSAHKYHFKNPSSTQTSDSAAPWTQVTETPTDFESSI